MKIYKSPFKDIAIPDLSITDLVLDGLKKAPAGPVLSCEVTGHSITASALEDRIRRFAGGLVARGHKPGTVVAIMSGNTPEFATVFHGTALAGGTVTTVNPTYTGPELHHQLKDSGAKLLVVAPALLPLAQEAIKGTAVDQLATLSANDGAPSIDDLFGPALERQVPVDLKNQPVVLPYSSGTTGLPKGVRLSHRNLVANVVQTQDLMALKPGDVTLAVLPFFHIYGMQVLMNLYLSQGGRLVTLPRFDLELALKVLSRERAEKFFVAPPIVLALAKHPMVDNFDLSALNFVLSGAAPLGGDLSETASRRLGAEVTQGYGMTEASPVTHFTPPGQNRPGTVGPLAPMTEARIVNAETGEDAEEGEIWIRGPQVMLGYLNNADATARTLSADGWLHTGDSGRVSEDGYFSILDRVKELIKVSGFQVAPAEVEAVLQSHPKIADVAVTAMPDPETGERPCAHVVVKQGEAVTQDEILAFLSTSLAPYKRPTRITFVEAIPKSASGKILRRLLKA